MPKLYDKTDLYFSHKGDLVISPEGDLYDTSDDPLRSLVQEIRTRIRSSQQDWELYKELGADLYELVGEPNNKRTAESGKAKIISALALHGLVDTNDISVSYLPVGTNRIMYRIKIRVMPTIENYGTEEIKVDLIHNYSNEEIHVF